MRKLAAVEVAALVSTLVVGTAVHADEPPMVLPTVTVTGHYYPNNRFQIITNTNVTPTTRPGSIGYRSSSETAQVFHALMCAYAYGKPGYKGAKGGFTAHFDTNYGWRTTSAPYQIKATTSHTAPSGYPVEINGITFRTGDGTSGSSQIFMAGLPNMVEMIRTLAHEYAHQWGAQDLGDGSPNDAYAIGDYAADAYEADGGEACGGLM